ncbi:MAG: hypothetical protein ABIK28_16050 [Planctomycetota bacterium]
MSGNFKGPTGLLVVCPEVTQGTPNWDVKQLDPAPASKVSMTVDVVAGVGSHDLNLASATADFLNGLYLYCKAGANAGEVKKISDFAVALGVATFTIVAPGFTANITAGDQFYIGAPLQASNPKITPKYDDLPRDEWIRQTLDAVPSLKGVKMVSGSFDFELPGLVQENGNGDTPASDRFSHITKGVGTLRSVAGQLAAAGSTTGIINVVSAAAWLAGDALLATLADGNEMSIIQSIATNAVTVLPAMTSAPALSAEVWNSERVTPDDSGHQSFTFLFLQDDQLVECRGCLIELSISGSATKQIKASIEFDGEDWDMQDTFTLDGEQEKTPIEFDVGRVHFGTVEVDVNAFEFKVGHERVLLTDTGVGHRYYITKRKSTLKITFRNKTVVPKETWEAAGTEALLVLQIGDTASGGLCIYGTAQIQDPSEFTKVEDHVYWDATFVFCDGQTSASTPRKARIARF